MTKLKKVKVPVLPQWRVHGNRHKSTNNRIVRVEKASTESVNAIA